MQSINLFLSESEQGGNSYFGLPQTSIYHSLQDQLFGSPISIERHRMHTLLSSTLGHHNQKVIEIMNAIASSAQQLNESFRIDPEIVKKLMNNLSQSRNEYSFSKFRLTKKQIVNQVFCISFYRSPKLHGREPESSEDYNDSITPLYFAAGTQLLSPQDAIKEFESRGFKQNLLNSVFGNNKSIGNIGDPNILDASRDMLNNGISKVFVAPTGAGYRILLQNGVIDQSYRQKKYVILED